MRSAGAKLSTSVPSVTSTEFSVSRNVTAKISSSSDVFACYFHANSPELVQLRTDSPTSPTIPSPSK